jgi:branched-chain amino acid transport system substrate-binding protein
MPVKVRVALGLLGLALLIPTLIGTQCRGADEEKDEPGVVALASPGCGELEYEGKGDPDVLVASDLTLAGPSRRASLQIVEAIRYELERRGWEAGDHHVAYQSCDDAKAGARNAARCRDNARAFADAPTLVGVVGTYYSDCAKIAVPLLNTAVGGPIAMLSPLNVDVCLTEPSPGCDRTEPDKYYPTGTRNYARLAPNEIYQAAALAQLAKRLGVARVFVLTDREAYGVGIAAHFERAARQLGIRIVGTGSWTPKEASYTALLRDVARSGADAILLGGVAAQDGARLIREKVAVLGANDAKVRLLAPDGFAEPAVLDEAGAAAAGMYVLSPGVSLRSYGMAARAFARRFAAERLGGAPVDPFALHGAEAIRVLLDAIAGSDGTRRTVLRALFRTRAENGLLGSYALGANGDPFPARGPVVAFTIYRAGGRFVPQGTVMPEPALVAAARGRRP